MHKTLLYKHKGKEHAIHYSIHKHPKAKHVKIAVERNGMVKLTMPKRYSIKAAELFLRSKVKWVIAQQQERAHQKHHFPAIEDKASYQEHKEAARELVMGKLLQFNQHYKFTYTGVSIRNQKTRWGSCSESGKLSFNYRIVFLPAELQDYIIVHELCHLQEMNHSALFWKLLEQTIPQAKRKAKIVRSFSIS